MVPATPSWFDEIDHTGDVGIVVRAARLELLFARAAWGLFHVIADVEAVRPAEGRRLAVEAGDRGALLRQWLTELNYLHLVEHRLFCRFDVTALADGRLEAIVYGEPIDPDRHTVYTEVKAVTFHGLDVSQTPEGWRAQVIFDM